MPSASISEQFFTFQTQNHRKIANFTFAQVFGIDIWLIFGLFAVLYGIFISKILHVLKTSKKNSWKTIVSYAFYMLLAN